MMNFLHRLTMMRKVKVLFFAADPHSVPPHGTRPRLLLDEEVRQVNKRVNRAVFGNKLEFDWRPAARTRDLQQALEDTTPEIVHFSGHGGARGLVLGSASGTESRGVDAAVLRELFQKGPRSVRLVVLTACHSRAQAEAIKEVVGCAIGTRDQISDAASITFNAKFYSAIASGRSVQDAFERARLALRLEHLEEGEILELLHRDDVDPAKLVFVSRARRFARVAAVAAVALGLSGAAAIIIIDPPSPEEPGILRLGECSSGGVSSVRAESAGRATAWMASNTPSEAATYLAQAKAFCQAGEYDSAVAYFERAAREENAEAMSFLGIAYLSGEGTNRDSVRGVELLRKAAREERHPVAQNALGVVYENDEKMSRNYYLSRHWYEQSAKQGYAEAMRNLGRLYRDAVGVARDDSLALAWFEAAADAGSGDAWVDIGGMHEEGRGVPRNPRVAFQHYQTAVAEGSPLGMYALGRANQQGIGTPPNDAQAHAWFLKGACEGSAEAMNALGVMYQNGLGVKADRGEAIEWFRRGAEAGSRLAAANLEKLQRRGVGKLVGLLDRPGASGCATSHA